jgi:hypothetical protein
VSSFSAADSAGKFPKNLKIRRKQLPTKIIPGNQNPKKKKTTYNIISIFSSSEREKTSEIGISSLVHAKKRNRNKDRGL